MPQPDASKISRNTPLPMRHDQFFKETFSDLLLAREFFQRTLPPDIAQCARWETLELIPNSFVSSDLADSEADLLYLMEIRGDTDGPAPPAIYLYVLFEHQSTVDWNMPFRLLKYIIRVWEAQEKGKMLLFPVLPVIFHQEAGGWKAPRGIWEWLCIKNKNLQPLEFLRPWVPDFRHVVLETKDMGELAGAASVLLGLRVSLMKAAAEEREMEWWDEHEEQLKEIVNGDARAINALWAMITYMFSTAPKNEHSTIVEKMEKLQDRKLKGIGMSVADVFIEQGMIKGKIEGKIEGMIKGELIGSIRTLQMVLNVEQMPKESLEQWSIEELEKLSRELMSRLHG